MKRNETDEERLKRIENKKMREKEVAKIYREKNKERMSKYKKEYEKNNRDKINERIREKRKNNIEFRLAENLRHRIRMAVRTKSNNSMILIGCSPAELKKYLESKFQDGMSWDNYGKWHIDHIRPCASFNLVNEEEQKQCFHYTNLQPLWATENRIKYSKFE